MPRHPASFYTAFVSTDQQFAPLGSRVSAELVDRDDVLALARRRWAESIDGRGQFLLLSGEAGIGKSRLLDEIAHALGDPPMLTTRAWPRDAEFPGAVLIDLARELKHAGQAELSAALTDRLLDDP